MIECVLECLLFDKIYVTVDVIGLSINCISVSACASLNVVIRLCYEQNILLLILRTTSYGKYSPTGGICSNWLCYRLSSYKYLSGVYVDSLSNWLCDKFSDSRLVNLLIKVHSINELWLRSNLSIFWQLANFYGLIIFILLLFNSSVYNWYIIYRLITLENAGSESIEVNEL